jgi:twitching motility two-component system response regulator PilH
MAEDPLDAHAWRRVLIADDDQDTREMISWCMRAAGWLVSEAADGQEAIELAAAVKPHVIVMDVCMPALNGLDATVCLKLDARTRDIPVVICTGLDRAWVEEQAERIRYDALVSKPCSPEHLVVLVEQLTNGTRCGLSSTRRWTG